jgi:hypothetical protein
MLLFVLPRGHVTSMSFRKLNFQLIKCSAFHLLASKDLNCLAFQCRFFVPQCCFIPNTVYFNSWLLWHLLFDFFSFATCFIIWITRVLTHYTIIKFKCPRGHVTSMSFRKLNFLLIKCSAFHLLASKDLNCLAFQCFNYGRTRKGFQKMRHLCILSLQYSDFQLFLVWNFSYLFVFSSIELYGCVLETTTMDGLLLRSLQIIEFEDIKWAIRIRKSKNRQHNGQKKKDKRTNNNLQTMCSGRVQQFLLH